MSVIVNNGNGHIELADIIDMPTYQNNHLNTCKDRAEFIKCIGMDGTGKTFGDASKPREQDPSMSELLTWGLDEPNRRNTNKNDYTKNNADLTNKIRKMQTVMISENHDNYRKPEDFLSARAYIFNFLDKTSIEKYKRWLYKNYEEKAREDRNRTMYKEQFGGNSKFI
jgi:hypothetical protein